MLRISVQDDAVDKFTFYSLSKMVSMPSQGPLLNRTESESNVGSYNKDD
jgi:hypothetical protein